MILLKTDVVATQNNGILEGIFFSSSLDWFLY